ncbi:kinesin-4-like [Dorcoceras hygrometricum]|uniref:Kinesin-4-like n=1 Tax=Dorcoceras hygrometricum TaxID=472368 RepID=A0A2Z7D6V3_9LAMI|nr:kinesin-4-like [Dorcoceras hygrometricum]
METKPLILILFFTLLLQKKQTESLSMMKEGILRNNPSIDRGHFNASRHFREAKVYSHQGTKEGDRIERLPGQPYVKFNQYGGYVTVNQTAGRAFFYYFAEAQNSDKTLPLLLWLNGGPGCSSLAYGAMQELGPFRVQSDGKTLYKNKFAWNYAANVLFLESPAGVGFSYSNTSSDVIIGGDSKTAADNYAFLLNWLERFPEYKNRDFYIAGESYAGHYVPQLAHTILYHNHEANKDIVNLKGIMIGNAVINEETDSKGMYEFFASHALISDQTFNDIMNHCDFSSYSSDESKKCSQATEEAEKNIGNIDIYNIYAPLCANSSITQKPKKTSGLVIDPCSDYYVLSYLNRPEVQQALHANVTKINYDWEPCSDVIKKWLDSPSTVIPLLGEFMSNGLRVWIFSGDIDGRIPVTSTLNSIKQMNLTVKTRWHPWYLAGEPENIIIDISRSSKLRTDSRSDELRTDGRPGNSDLVDFCSGASEDTQEFCSYSRQTLPVLQKIQDLGEKVKIIRNEHAFLCNEVKGFTAHSLIGSEALTALQNLVTEHELLKKKSYEECELLKKKYLEESSERKNLYNEIIELKGNIRVFCRCRPLKQEEIENGLTSIIDFTSSKETELQIICSDSSRKQFKLDHVFRPEDSQEAVFVQTLPIVTSVLDGYNACIFAYGQTGTGKTYTMEGAPENRGVNYRTLEELFRLSKERNCMKYELFVSMLEVYNEKIRDLLVENSNQPAKKLEIKQSAEGTQEVPGLVEAKVFGTDEVWRMLELGSRVRSVGSTNANELSSRSHCLLRVTVVGENSINGERTKSHLWLVDLAGSERVGKIEIEGERLKESQFINKSLSALGDVVSALASKSSHIPYRNSKLTHLLQSSLGGDCKTLMFVQISPIAADVGETLCSLNFASRVRGVEHGPARKQPDHAELLKYKQLAEKAKLDEKEVKKLQDNIQALQLRLVAREHICKNLQEKVRDLETQLDVERKTRIKQETRVLSSISTKTSAVSTSNRGQNTTDKKPPLPPTKLRLPLRRITNFMPNPSPIPSNKHKFLPVVDEHKENRSDDRAKPIFKARRGSVVVRPLPSTNQLLQPRRRASVATLHPESNSNLTTPLHYSTVRSRPDRAVGRQSFVWDPKKVWRRSRVSSPLPQAATEATPLSFRSSKFRGSPPPSQASGSMIPKHPAVVALHKKQLVWSPLKLRSMKNNRKSFLSLPNINN